MWVPEKALNTESQIMWYGAVFTNSLGSSFLIFKMSLSLVSKNCFIETRWAARIVEKRSCLQQKEIINLREHLCVGSWKGAGSASGKDRLGRLCSKQLQRSTFPPGFRCLICSLFSKPEYLPWLDHRVSYLAVIWDRGAAVKTLWFWRHIQLNINIYIFFCLCNWSLSFPFPGKLAMSLTQLKDYVSYKGPGDWRTFKGK